MEKVIPYNYRVRSGVIHNKKCILYCIVVTPDGTNKSYVDVYDGENTSHPKFSRFRTLASRSCYFYFCPPVQLQKGLYIDFGANLESVTIGSEVV